MKHRSRAEILVFVLAIVTLVWAGIGVGLVIWQAGGVW